MKASRVTPVQGDAVLLARVNEALQNARFRSRPSFVGFLDERQALLASGAAARQRDVRFALEGGYEGAARVLFGAFPLFVEPERESFPLEAVTVCFRAGAQLSHRDLLGSLMSLGVERDVLGDLLLEDGRAVFFARSEMAPFFVDQLKKVGGEGVRVSAGAQMPLPGGAGFAELSATIASARLDCVVAALCNCSRGVAAEMIGKGMVLLNFTECTAVAADVAEEDQISVRGKGKFAIDQMGPQTKKGRLGFRARKYI